VDDILAMQFGNNVPQLVDNTNSLFFGGDLARINRGLYRRTEPDDIGTPEGSPHNGDAAITRKFHDVPYPFEVEGLE
jgi:hypothetical protein